MERLAADLLDRTFASADFRDFVDLGLDRALPALEACFLDGLLGIFD